MALSDKQQGDVYNWLEELKIKANYGTHLHPNYGDLVNDVAKLANQNTDAKFAALEADLKAIRAYLTAGP